MGYSDSWINHLCSQFDNIPDHRGSNAQYSLTDCLRSGYAMFSLKDSSLLEFRRNLNIRSSNLEKIYGITKVPGDTALRNTLDGVDPSSLLGIFSVVWSKIRSQGFLSGRAVLGKYHLVVLDGTEHYCSSKQHCDHCLERSRRNGLVEYHHQMLAAVQVNPGESVVFPVCVEPIVQQDGSSKNDCEKNAAKRLLPSVRSIMGEEQVVIVADALYADGVFIKLLKEQNMSYIIVIKNSMVLVQAERLRQAGLLDKFSYEDKKYSYEIEYTNGLFLNGTHSDISTNYLRLTQKDKKTGKIIYQNEWISDIPLEETTVTEVSRSGRSRWKVENETFNTLKNQGYNLEHNYGHGKKYLASVFAILMFLAFLIDQLLQYKDVVFQRALAKSLSKKRLWEKIRRLFDICHLTRMETILKIICGDLQLVTTIVNKDIVDDTLTPNDS